MDSLLKVGSGGVCGQSVKVGSGGVYRQSVKGRLRWCLWTVLKVGLGGVLGQCGNGGHRRCFGDSPLEVGLGGVFGQSDTKGVFEWCFRII